jgi:hypothetical protein
MAFARYQNHISKIWLLWFDKLTTNGKASHGRWVRNIPDTLSFDKLTTNGRASHGRWVGNIPDTLSFDKRTTNRTINAHQRNKHRQNHHQSFKT